MAQDLFVDTSSKQLVVSETSSAPVGTLNFYYGDTVDLNLVFLQETRVLQNPLSVVDFTGQSVTVSVGTTTGGAVLSQPVWNDSHLVTASTAVSITGDANNSSIQTLTFTGIPSNGSYNLSLPGISANFTTSLTASAFITPNNHGLIVGSQIALSWSGQILPAFGSSVPNQGTYTVASVPTPTSFTVKNSSGTVLSPTPALGYVVGTTSGSSATIVDDQSDVFYTAAAHSLSQGQTVTISSPGILAGITAGVGYYVASVPTPTSFTLGIGAAPTVTCSGQTCSVVAASGSTLTINGTSSIFSPTATITFTGTINGLTAGTIYYVKTISGTSLTVSATSGGSAITGLSLSLLSGTSYSSFVGTYQTPVLTTSSIAATASASDIQTALSALTTIGSGNVLVSGVAPNFTIQFVNQLAFFPVNQLGISYNFPNSPYKYSSLTFSGSQISQLVANNSDAAVLEITLINGSNVTTLAQCPVKILPSVTSGGVTSGSPVADFTRIPFPPMILGGDYSFGIRPINPSTGNPIDVTQAQLTATLSVSNVGPVIGTFNVTMPTTTDGVILCTLPGSVTANYSITDSNTSFFITLLLIQTDGSILPLGTGYVSVNP